MKAIRKFTVRAILPEPLAELERIAGNLRWSWHEPTRRLFAHISAELWESSGHDPITLLGEADPERLQELAGDADFLAGIATESAELRAYLEEPRWYQSLEGAPGCIAYFSPEFGITSALPQYSGGLGILAGDHLKAASDLGVPLVGVGLFYRAGYFQQGISSEGWQTESYPLQDPDGLPLAVLRHPDGSPVHITLALAAGRTLHARVLQAAVGRITLLLLDTDIPENEAALRVVTDRLYGGGGEHRLLQELLLGIGGARALAQWAELGGHPQPEVFHSNEGHAGFLGLERISNFIGRGLSFAESWELARAGTVFTTHTPVAAGIDRFPMDLVRSYFATDLLPGVNVEQVLKLGQEEVADGTFNMALMGLRLAQRANGVSKLHGEVSRRMFGGLWPGFDTVEVPIGSITNGVHAPTWTDPALLALAEERLGTIDTSTADWSSERLRDGELWDVKNGMRARMIDDARARIERSWSERNPGVLKPEWLGTLLSPAVLTIGFARRVPTYKRLTLMLHDTDRLRALLTHPERPVQIVVAGKSHPADDEGKRLIQRLVQFAQDPDVRERIVFLPDYDIGMAQLLYPGCDVWLNNPLRPLEACGTSGMKAALNGALNLSILDGWWAEFYDGENGWAIPSAGAAIDPAERDRLEAEALYELIENRVAPRFYDRDRNDVPRRWMASMRHTLATLSPALSAERMVREYVETMYRPAAASEAGLSAADFTPARELAAWKARVRAAWPSVSVAHVESGGIAQAPHVGDALHLRAHIELGDLAPEDVTVEVVYGRSHNGEDLTDTRHTKLRPDAANPNGGARLFTGTIALDRAGGFGYTVRVVPHHSLLASPAELGLIAVA